MMWDEELFFVALETIEKARVFGGNNNVFIKGLTYPGGFVIFDPL